MIEIILADFFRMSFLIGEIKKEPDKNPLLRFGETTNWEIVSFVFFTWILFLFFGQLS